MEAILITFQEKVFNYFFVGLRQLKTQKDEGFYLENHHSLII
ncbi:MAG TPA: hypothetical protein VIQ23_17995 [Hanamia sp.]